MPTGSTERLIHARKEHTLNTEAVDIDPDQCLELLLPVVKAVYGPAIVKVC
jgi:hypothetical protein